METFPMVRKAHLRLFWVLLLSLAPGFSKAQLVFTAPADFGGLTGVGLFQTQNGTVSQIPTGFPDHLFPAVSRSGRFIVFSSPDGVQAPLQVPPSSDIYIFDRLIRQTRRVVDHNTIIQSPSEVDSFTPVSAVMSPNEEVIAYGVMLTRREGTANPRSTRELNIARVSDGLILANPTFGRGPVSDGLQAEFVGISWDPGGTSFVTPSYTTIQTQTGQLAQLPAIVRFALDRNRNWVRAEVLSAPRSFDGSFPIGAEAHMYPAISPSGTGLAYFNVAWPDVLGSSQPVITSVIIANANGSNARVLTSFNQGFYPAGLAWSPDGTQLIVSIAEQSNIGTGFLPSADPASAVVRTISTANGQLGTFPGLDAGFWPSWSSQLLQSGPLQNARLTLGSSSNGDFRLRASGLVDNAPYFLQSSPTLQPGSFGQPVQFTGSQLEAGIPVSFNSPNRFFRLVDPNAL